MNLDNVEPWAPGAILSPGQHTVRVAEADDSKQSKNGYPQIILKLEAIEGPETGGTITDWITITPNSLGRVRQILEAFQYQIPAGDFQLAASHLVYRTARIVVREETGQDGRTRSQVKAYEPSGSGAAADNGIGSDPFAGTTAAPVDDSIPF
jgi:hypothetical protein